VHIIPKNGYHSLLYTSFKILLAELLKIVELHPLFGEYDLIVKINANDFEELGTIIVNKIRSIPGVLDTKTLTGLTF
jgi:DNA-binding Lrp family transcriptional regulator